MRGTGRAAPWRSGWGIFFNERTVPILQWPAFAQVREQLALLPLVGMLATCAGWDDTAVSDAGGSQPKRQTHEARTAGQSAAAAAAQDSAAAELGADMVMRVVGRQLRPRQRVSGRVEGADGGGGGGQHRRLKSSRGNARLFLRFGRVRHPNAHEAVLLDLGAFWVRLPHSVAAAAAPRLDTSSAPRPPP